MEVSKGADSTMISKYEKFSNFVGLPVRRIFNQNTLGVWEVLWTIKNFKLLCLKFSFMTQQAPKLSSRTCRVFKGSLESSSRHGPEEAYWAARVQERSQSANKFMKLCKKFQNRRRLFHTNFMLQNEQRGIHCLPKHDQLKSVVKEVEEKESPNPPTKNQS